jgi:hypothetical protein
VFFGVTPSNKTHYSLWVFLFPRRLDANHITSVPEDSFEGLVQLRHLWLDDNILTEVPVRPLSNLPTLQALTLALNNISSIPDFAFTNLSSLVVLYVLNLFTPAYLCYFEGKMGFM